MDPALRDVWSQFWDGAPELKDRLVLQYAPLVKFIAHRIPGDPKEAVERSLESLTAAIESYQPEHGSFEHYAMEMMSGDVYSWESGGWAESA